VCKLVIKMVMFHSNDHGELLVNIYCLAIIYKHVVKGKHEGSILEPFPSNAIILFVSLAINLRHDCDNMVSPEVKASLPLAL